MNVFLGSTGVLLGLSAAVLGSITLVYALVKKRTDLQWLAVPYTGLIVLGAVLAVFAMERALITRDFTVKFVADNGSSRTPALYNVATLWAALEGSIILWALILSGYTAVVVAKFRRRLSDPLVGWAVLTMFVVAAFFFFLMAFPANPFKSFHPPPGFDGPGPNPLLQNHPLMAFHPPMLYLGYVGFTVPFAFAIAALATGRVGEGWLVATRRWTLFAWGFLTVGIVLGALVVVRGARMGRLLGLGSGRERVVPAVVDRYRIPAFGDGARATGDAARLEPVVVVRHVLVDHPRHVHHSFGRARFGPCVHRERHRSVDPRVLHRDGRGHDRVDRVAGRSFAITRPHRLSLVARGRVLGQQRVVRTVCVRRPARHRVPAVGRGDQQRPRVGRLALLQPHDVADRHRAAVPDGGGARAAVAQGQRRAAARSTVLAGVGRVRRRW